MGQGFASQDQKEEIRSRLPLEDIVREYSVRLIPSGRRLKGLCPFHREKTPSFHVDPERQFFYCFGCQEKGDLFDFVRKMDNLDFVEALEVLARRAGVTLERRSGERRGDGGVRQRDALDFANEFYHQLLVSDPCAARAREYLSSRGIEVGMWERFSLGYSPPDGQSLVRAAGARGFDAALLERVGLARSREGYGRAGHYDLFRGRLLFPIADPSGRVIGFGGRTLGDDQPKYVNTPRTTLFDKSQVLYGLHLARRGIQSEGAITIVEGYTDVILAHQLGIDHVVASLGTAFTAENAARLGRLSSRVILIFDGDAAGQRAIERSLDLLVRENLDVRVFSIPDGMDPAEAVLAWGGEEFRRRVGEDAVSLLEFKWRRTMESGEADSATLQARALDEFLQLVAGIPNVVTRKLHLRHFAEKIRVPEGDLETRLKDLTKGGAAPTVRRSPAGVAAGRTAEPEVPADGSGIEHLIVECMLALPDRVQEILAYVPAGFLRDRALLQLVQNIERQLQLGTYAPARLIHEVDDPDARRELLGLLSRIEMEDGSPARDYGEVWRLAQRDIGRENAQRRVREVKLALNHETPGSARRAELQGELFQIMRELKRVRKD